jgi:hypothetical protein
MPAVADETVMGSIVLRGLAAPEIEAQANIKTHSTNMEAMIFFMKEILLKRL